MIKTSKKDVHQNKKPANTTTSTQADKQFEADVQERIRQAKMQLKATSPFLSDEEKKELENTYITETPHTLKEQVSSSLVSDSLNEMRETLTSVQTANQHLNQDLRKAQERIADLEKDLKVKLTQSDKQAIQYGGGGIANGNDVMTKNDLKIEFLNFTSAHIDQFNNRIKKTEDIVANYVKTAPQEQKMQKLAPQWLPWLNAILLTLSSILLIGILYTLNSNKNSTQINTTPITSSTENKIPEKSEDISKLNDANTKQQKADAIAKEIEAKKATPTPVVIAKPAPIVKPILNVNAPVIAAKPTPNVTPSQAPIAKPVVSNTPSQTPKPILKPAVNNIAVQAQKPANTSNPAKSNIVVPKPLPASTPATRPSSAFAAAKPAATAPIQNKPTIATPVVKPVAKALVINKEAKPPIQSAPSVVSKATKPIAKKSTTADPSKNVVAAYNAKRQVEKENNNLREALQPVENNVTKRKANITPVQKKSTPKESVYFGED